MILYTAIYINICLIYTLVQKDLFIEFINNLNHIFQYLFVYSLITQVTHILYYIIIF